jgi:hypothetical protein
MRQWTGHRRGGAWHPQPVEEPVGRCGELHGKGHGGRWRCPMAGAAHGKAEGVVEGEAGRPARHAVEDSGCLRWRVATAAA